NCSHRTGSRLRLSDSNTVGFVSNQTLCVDRSFRRARAARLASRWDGSSVRIADRRERTPHPSLALARGRGRGWECLKFAFFECAKFCPCLRGGGISPLPCACAREGQGVGVSEVCFFRVREVLPLLARGRGRGWECLKFAFFECAKFLPLLARGRGRGWECLKFAFFSTARRLCSIIGNLCTRFLSLL